MECDHAVDDPLCGCDRERRTGANLTIDVFAKPMVEAMVLDNAEGGAPPSPSPRSPAFLSNETDQHPPALPVPMPVPLHKLNTMLPQINLPVPQAVPWQDSSSMSPSSSREGSSREGSSGGSSSRRRSHPDAGMVATRGPQVQQGLPQRGAAERAPSPTSVSLDNSNLERLGQDIDDELAWKQSQLNQSEVTNQKLDSQVDL